MANKDSRLLSTEEQWDIYSPPALNAFERAQYFSLSPEETRVLQSFRDIKSAVYFLLSLVFLKLKGTLIKDIIQISSTAIHTNANLMRN